MLTDVYHNVSLNQLGSQGILFYIRHLRYFLERLAISLFGKDPQLPHGQIDRMVDITSAGNL